MILSLLSETTGGSDMEFDKQQLEHFLTVSKVFFDKTFENSLKNLDFFDKQQLQHFIGLSEEEKKIEL